MYGNNKLVQALFYVHISTQIRPYLEYGLLIRGSRYSFATLDAIQKRVMKLISDPALSSALDYLANYFHSVIIMRYISIPYIQFNFLFKGKRTIYMNIDIHVFTWEIGTFFLYIYLLNQYSDTWKKNVFFTSISIIK